MTTISIDVETTCSPNHLPWIPNSYLVSIAICKPPDTLRSWLFNHPEAFQSQREILNEVQEELDAATRIVAHNLKFDLHWLRYLGLYTEHLKLYCTQVAEYVLSGQTATGNLGLADLSEKYGLPCKIDKTKIYWDSGYQTDEIPASILIPYGEQDVINALAIYNKQVPQIKELGMERLIAMEMELIPVLCDMESNGMKIDVDKLSEYSVSYKSRGEEIDEELRELLGIENIDSGDQLSCGLFGGRFLCDGVEEVERILKGGQRKTYTRKCQVERVVKGLGFSAPAGSELKKAGFYSTGIPILQQLKAKTPEQKRALELLLERSRLEQLRSTYFDGLREREVNGYVHPSLNQTITKTGRLSCSNPNLQNQPRGNTGPVKECFITRYG